MLRECWCYIKIWMVWKLKGSEILEWNDVWLQCLNVKCRYIYQSENYEGYKDS